MGMVGFWWESSSCPVDCPLRVSSQGLSSVCPLVRALILLNLGSIPTISLTLCISLSNYQRRLRFMDNELQTDHNSAIRLLPGQSEKFDLNTWNFHIAQWAYKKNKYHSSQSQKVECTQVKFYYSIEKYFNLIELFHI